MGVTIGFRAIVDQRLVFTTLRRNWTAHVFYLSACLCDAIYRTWESRLEKIRTLVPHVYQPFLAYFFGPKLRDLLQSSLKLSLFVPKWFNAIQVLKFFLFLLKVTSIIFACATNTDIWKAVVVCATESLKNCSEPPQSRLQRIGKSKVLMESCSNYTYEYDLQWMN